MVNWEKEEKRTVLAIAKCHRQGSLNNRNVFLVVLEDENSKIKVPANLGLGGGPASWLVDSCLLTVSVCLWGDLWGGREGGGQSWWAPAVPPPLLGPVVPGQLQVASPLLESGSGAGPYLL